MKQFISWLISTSGLAWTTFIIVIAQAFHYFNFFYGFEMYTNWVNYVYALFLTIVLSLPLMIFTTKLGSIPMKSANKTQAEIQSLQNKYSDAVNLYTWLDILVNIYTWYMQLDAFFGFEYKFIPKYFVATLIAVVLPLTLKKFAGELKIR